jgi:SagB-type dehydrogenase family enzyme
MRVRRAARLLCYWNTSGFEIARPDRKERVKVSGRILHLLADLNEWTDTGDIKAHSYGLEPSGIASIISTLVSLRIIAASDEECDQACEAPDIWQAWGPFAQYYHALTKDAKYVIGGAESLELDQQLTAAAPMPAQFKSYGKCPLILLPRASQRVDMPLIDALVARRTHRSFEERSISVDHLSTVLHYTFAPQRFVNASLFGTLQMKTSPSAGSRHEAECYVVPMRVDGVPAGIYHYDGLRHALEQVCDELEPDYLSHLVYGQEPFLSSAFICFTTAVAGRLAWKYRHPRAYRLWMMDAGHYGQTFALVSTALGLGAFQSVAFRDSALEEILALDPNQEFGVYALAAGYPTSRLPGPPERYATAASDVSIAEQPGRGL